MHDFTPGGLAITPQNASRIQRVALSSRPGALFDLVDTHYAVIARLDRAIQ
jgi:hypothetical protein